MPVPDIFLERAWAIDQIARRLFRVEATVEDTSEATLRAYEIIAEADRAVDHGGRQGQGMG